MSSLDKNSVDRALEHFMRKIILNKGQYERAQSAVNSIKKIFSESELCPPNTSIYEQGSFSTRTTLKPDTKRVITAEFDVDIAVESSGWDLANARAALQIIYASLNDSGVRADKLKIKKSCVRIKYADGPAGEKFHVDVVPVLNYGGKKYAPKCTDDENLWIESDPGKLTRWFNNKNINEPTFRAQYLLLKRFAQMNGIKIPSIAIQKLALDAYTFKSSGSRYVRELLDMCRTIVQNLNSPEYNLVNPINDQEDIQQRIKAGELEKYKDLIIGVVKSIERFSTNGTYEDVVLLFGDEFPTKESHERELSLRANSIYFDCDFADRVNLTASADKGTIRDGSYTLVVSSDHKNYDNRPAVDRVKFTAEVPNHHSALWQIMNDPIEVNFQIRGNFESSNENSSGSNVEHRSESVSYAGKHFVRAFIIKGNRYKAVSHKFNVHVSRAVAV
jgi:hypothetical protein